jgi:putative SOS response-associated peptidase YedK
MYTWRELVALYRLTDPSPPSNLQQRYNICPTTTIDAVLEHDGTRTLAQMRWGLIPSWWNKPLKEMRLSTFNARAETVASKPMFRSAFKRNRCIIPASGYYEWQTTPDGKQPYYFTAKDGPILSIAGLWDEW